MGRKRIYPSRKDYMRNYMVDYRKQERAMLQAYRQIVGIKPHKRKK